MAEAEDEMAEHRTTANRSRLVEEERKIKRILKKEEQTVMDEHIEEQQRQDRKSCKESRQDDMDEE